MMMMVVGACNPKNQHRAIEITSEITDANFNELRAVLNR